MILKKIKEEINYYKNNKKELIFLLLPIVIAIILLIPVPYVYTTGGGIIKLDKKIVVDDEYKSKGTLNAAYVKEVKGTVFTYLASKIMKYDEEKQEDMTLDNETMKEYSFRERMYFEDSINNAIFVAYNKAGKDINIKGVKYYVVYIDEKSNTTLKVKDEIIKIDGKEVTSYKELKERLNSYEVNDKITITVIRDGKEKDETAIMQNIDNEKVIGLYVLESYDYTLENDIEFLFSSKEAGPSGGLMLSLTIYNKLTNEDITKGKKIVGTGTIDKDGVVGEISGIKYKLKGAVNSKADVFITPYENYEEAIKEKKKNNYDIKIIYAKDFDDAINKLKNL